MHGLTWKAWLTTPLPVNEQDLTQRLKAQLTLFSVDEIERRIKSLNRAANIFSVIKEDKKIMEEIKSLIEQTDDSPV